MTRKPFMVHIPKTGGSWARLSVMRHIPGLDDLWQWGTHQVCSKKILQQLSIENKAYKPVHPVDHRDYPFECNISINRPVDLPKDKRLVLATARHPLDILVSHFYDGEDGWSNVRTRQNTKTFDEYIRAYCDEETKWWCEPLKKDLFFQAKNENEEYVIDLWLCNTNDLDREAPSLNKQLAAVLKKCYPENIINNLQNLNEGNRGGQYSRRRPDRNWRKFYTSETYDLAMKKTENELVIYNKALAFWKSRFQKD